jgi:galactosylceramide sulfotransferase/galactose-3-O-sulfotransferase 3
MIMENMEQSLILLRHVLGWDLLDIVSLPLNQQTTRLSDPLKDLNQHQRNILQEVNAADHLLYKKFLELFEDRVKEFGAKRMETELDAYRCLNQEVYDACNIASYKAAELPKIYRPYGNTIGYFAALDYSMSSDLFWLCPRITLSELSYIEQLRLKQRYFASKSDKKSC